jgi:hypothetical protein
MSKLKSVIKVATDAVRKAAEQRQSDAALRAHGGAQGESPQVAPLRLQVLLMQQWPAASLPSNLTCQAELPTASSTPSTQTYIRKF